MAELRVLPARDAGWQAVDAVFQAEASARNCWCQFHVLSNRDAARSSRDTRRALLAEQIDILDPPRGLVALDRDEAVGWCGVEPRVRLHHVLASRLVRQHSPYDASDGQVWSVYCILVPPRYRRRGIGTDLLHAAIEHALAGGAEALEGYPIDTAARGGVLPPGFSTGTVGMFVDEGFHAGAALPSGRTLVHRSARADESGGRERLP
ncbi:GNAT family N-acetyltransferase [Microbacterium deminutum]